MLREWKEGAILELQGAAHHIDTELKTPIEWTEAFAKTGVALQDERFLSRFIKQLRSLPGVGDVRLSRPSDGPLSEESRHATVQITPPRYNPRVA